MSSCVHGNGVLLKETLWFSRKDLEYGIETQQIGADSLAQERARWQGLTVPRASHERHVAEGLLELRKALALEAGGARRIHNFLIISHVEGHANRVKRSRENHIELRFAQLGCVGAPEGGVIIIIVNVFFLTSLPSRFIRIDTEY